MKMYASVNVGNRRFGGYLFDRANIRVEYKDVNSEWRYSNENSFLAFLKYKWVGETCPENISIQKSNGRAGEFETKLLIAEGTEITSTHAEKLAEMHLCFQSTPFSVSLLREFDEWWARTGRRLLINEPRMAPSILVTVEPKNNSLQTRAELQLTPEAAEWLGIQLLQYSRAYRQPDEHVAEDFGGGLHATPSDEYLKGKLQLVQTTGESK